MKSDYIPIILIIAILAILGGTIFYISSWNTTFDQGALSFEIAGGWAQSQITGDFNNSVFSQVIFTQEFQDDNGAMQTAYIIVEMRQSNGGTNTSTLQESVLNVTNSTVTNLKINDYNIRQYVRTGPEVSNGISTITKGNMIIMIEYICPTSIANVTQQDYNELLKTIKIK